MTTSSAPQHDPGAVNDRDFLTWDEAASFLKSRTPESLDIAALINDVDIIAREPIEVPAPPGGFPHLVERYRWVIRNDDLNLFDCILEGLRGTASAGFFLAAGVSAPAQWGAVVGLATSLFKVFRNALLRGKQLSPDLFEIIITLKNGGPATADDLTMRLLNIGNHWNNSNIQHALDTLKALPMDDGTVRQLVAKGQDDRWQVSGI